MSNLSFSLVEMLHLERDVSKYSYLNVNKLAAVDDKEQFNVTVVSDICIQPFL